jgi:hypothetical protein
MGTNLSTFNNIGALFFFLFISQGFADSLPDFRLAYFLSAVSFCSYAVTEADGDSGQERATQCLQAAANNDRAFLSQLNVSKNNVEAYINPNSAEDAYLLVKADDAVILAFRGTLTPPISPNNSNFPAAVKDAVLRYKQRLTSMTSSFALDWVNNFQAYPNSQGRHSGFDSSWQGLRGHLSTSKLFNSIKNDLPDHKLLVTGHSKGGALAALAALDLPADIGVSTKIVLYTFSPAKVFTAKQAAAEPNTAATIWRFERSTDIVPSLPFDGSVPNLLPAYSHVGSLAFFERDKAVEFSPSPSGSADPVTDLRNLAQTVNNQTKMVPSLFDLNAIMTWLKKVPNLLSDSCASLVDKHFIVFADVEEIAHHADASFAPDTYRLREEDLDKSFFATGLSDLNNNQIIWGYPQWCRLFRESQFDSWQ